MTPAVEQAGNEHPVSFPPHRDGSLLQNHFSQFWYRGKPYPEGFPDVSPSAGSMGVATPPPSLARGILKLDVILGTAKSKEMPDLPHWMDSTRGPSQAPSRSDATPEAGPSTPMKCPPKQLVETPNTVLTFSSPETSYSGALLEPRNKYVWIRQEQTPILTAGVNYPVHVSSNRVSDQSGLPRDSSQAQRESQKENVMSLKELKSALQLMASPKALSSPPTGSLPIGEPPSIRALATLAESKTKASFPGDELQLHLRHEPCSRSPIVSPEKQAVDRRVRHELRISDPATQGMKQEPLNRVTCRAIDLDDSWTIKHLSKTEAHECPPPHNNEVPRSLISPARLLQQHRQVTVGNEGSPVLHADLSLALQPATESPRHAMWHGNESPPRLLAQKWSDIHSPGLNSQLTGNSSRCRSTNSTPSAQQNPAESLLLFHLTPSDNSAREQLREQTRVDDERMGGLSYVTAGVGKKRKHFRKVHKTADYSAGGPPVVELSYPSGYADLRLQIKKRVKKEASEVALSSADVLEAQEALEGNRKEGSSFQLCLQSSETGSHPKKHDFFPDKPRNADGIVTSGTQEFPLRKVRKRGTSPTLFENFATFSGNGVISDNAGARSFDATAPHIQSLSHQPSTQPAAGIDMPLRDTELGLGRACPTVSPSLAQCIKGTPADVQHLEEHSEVASSAADASWQRSRLFAVPAHAPMPIGHPTFSCGEPSLPLSLSCFAGPPRNPLGKSSLVATPKREEEWGKSLALSATPEAPLPSNEFPSAPTMNYQERFVLLQAYLKHCDEISIGQNAQALRTLSPAARSGVAVELESKAMWLSIEEALEMKRLNAINVMGWNMSNVPQPNQGDDGFTPRGRRLPGPGLQSSDMRPSSSFFAHSRGPTGVLTVAGSPSPFS